MPTATEVAQIDREKELIQHQMKSLLDASVAKQLETALSLIERDPHLWSKRPCQTCSAVSDIYGRPFGCVAADKYSKG